MITMTKIFTFDSAHYLPDYEGKCKNLHGHTYKLEVTVYRIGKDLIEGGSSDGMVMDFNDLKKIVEKLIIDKWDHCCINEVVDYRPTAENMCQHIFESLCNKLPAGVNVVSVKLWETPTSYVEVT